MATRFTNRKLRPRSIALLLTSALAIVGIVELSALKVYERVKHPPQNPDTQYCLKCHSDAKTVQRMREKEDGANYLFKQDGTFKDSKFAQYNPDYHKTHPLASTASVKAPALKY